MKFITEEDLRDSFRKEPFTFYELKAGQRLTPGGRQFLLDRGIDMYKDDSRIKKSTQDINEQSKKMDNGKNKKFYYKMKSIEALFLMTAQELLSSDVFLAQRVIDLGKQLSNCHSNLEKKSIMELSCKHCTGIRTDNFSDELDDCFEITQFHIQLEKGKEVITLHALRCAIRELEPFVLELFGSNHGEKEFCSDVISVINKSINTLSQMICSVLGGQKCQREN